jgi:hypothetical protein
MNDSNFTDSTSPEVSRHDSDDDFVVDDPDSNPSDSPSSSSSSRSSSSTSSSESDDDDEDNYSVSDHGAGDLVNNFFNLVT